MTEIPYRQDVFRKIEPPPSANPPFTRALYQVQEDRGSFSWRTEKLKKQAEKLKEKDPVTGESAAMRGAKTLNEKDPVTGESLGMKGTKRSSEVRTAKAEGERVARQYGQWKVSGITVHGIPRQEPGKRWAGSQSRRLNRLAEETSRNNEEADEGVLWSHGRWDTLPDSLQAQRAAEQQGISEGQREWHERLKREMDGYPETSSESE